MPRASDQLLTVMVASQPDNVMGAIGDDCLLRFEQKIIDDLAMAIIDPDSTRLDEQVEAAAELLGCTPLQAATSAATLATSVLRHTPRGMHGLFDELSFDLGYVRKSLYSFSSESAPMRPRSWGRRRA